MAQMPDGDEKAFVPVVFSGKDEEADTEKKMIEELSGDFFQQLRGFYYTAQTSSIRSKP